MVNCYALQEAMDAPEEASARLGQPAPAVMGPDNHVAGEAHAKAPLPSTAQAGAVVEASSSKDGGAVADAVMQRLEAMHKRLLAQLNASQANSLKAMREDMRRETKRIEAATQAQVMPVKHDLFASPTSDI
jgi:hypothetical protein